MSDVALKVQRRETGKQASKRYRRDGFVPGIYYIKGEEPIHILAKPLDMRPVVFTSTTPVIHLELEGEEKQYDCVLKDVTFNPITDEIEHFDLLGLKSGQMITVEVPISLEGNAPGVRSGGVLQHVIHKMKIHCLPKHMPDMIKVDVSKLEVGNAVHISDLQLDNVQYDYNEDQVICAVVKPRVSTGSEEEQGVDALGEMPSGGTEDVEETE